MFEKYISENWSKIAKNNAPLSSLDLSIGPNKKFHEDNKAKRDNYSSFSEEMKAYYSKVCVPICIYNNNEAVAWIKVSQNDRYNSLIEQEYRNLVYIYNRMGSKHRASVPTPIVYDTIEGKSFFIQGCAQGKKMKEQIRPWRLEDRMTYRKNLKLTVNWLLDFQTRTVKDGAVYNKGLVEKEILMPFFQSCQTDPLDEREEEFFDNYRKRLMGLDAFKVPVVSSHGDFFAGNILLNKSEDVVVIDWCDLERESNPFLDLFTLISTFRYRGRNDKANIIRSLRFSFLERSWLSKLIKQSVEEFMESAGYEFSLVKIFYPLFLMNRIIREFEATSGAITTQYWRDHLRIYIDNEDQFWS